ncbi:MAG: hypothetical protein ACLFUS_13165 [Candidatus Sumerlaeia bacterium]
MKFESKSAELARLRYQYKRKIQRGEIKLEKDDALPFIGPDCAYHLYRQVGVGKRKTEDGEE